ncbi:LacI family DNA-binding transcriptional regulator [Sphingobacterium sp. HJSM2_6]|uniref:LacI family DNA-binding transcriptional regulator n=1 Tax=Sphingobacterium sp. HJSM2_6 TaxID=3366264 RepID=UPI003BD2343B
MGISLKSIAQALNLSKTTVSWVLSGKASEKNISESTAKKVLDYANSIGYEPNLIARSLNTGETKTIGLILPSISDSFYSAIAKEIEANARKKGYSLMISSSESDIDREGEILRLFKSKSVDGIILAPTKRSKVEINRLIAEDYPLVTIDRYFPELNMNYIVINNLESCYLLTKHLLGKGCKNIAFITTNSYLTTMSFRKEGYEKAIQEWNFPINTALIGEVDFKGYERNLYNVLDGIFEKVPNVDAFVFSTQILALEAFQYFYDKGIAPDFEMASIHEEPIFKVLAPKINVAKMPVEEISINAVNILIDQIKFKRNLSKNPDARPALNQLMLSTIIEYRS